MIVRRYNGLAEYSSVQIFNSTGDLVMELNGAARDRSRTRTYYVDWPEGIYNVSMSTAYNHGWSGSSIEFWFDNETYVSMTIPYGTHRNQLLYFPGFERIDTETRTAQVFIRTEASVGVGDEFILYSKVDGYLMWRCGYEDPENPCGWDFNSTIPVGDYELYVMDHKPSSATILITVDGELFRVYQSATTAVYSFHIGAPDLDGMMTLTFSRLDTSGSVDLALSSVNDATPLYSVFSNSFTSYYVEYVPMQPGVYNMTFAFNKAISRDAFVTIQYEGVLIDKFFFPGDGNRFSLFTIPGEGVTPFPLPTETLPVSFTRQYYVSAIYEELFIYRALDGALLWHEDGRQVGDLTTKNWTMDLALGSYHLFFRCYGTCHSENSLLTIRMDDRIVMQLTPTSNPEHFSFEVFDRTSLYSLTQITRFFGSGSVVQEQVWLTNVETDAVAYSMGNVKGLLAKVDYIDLPFGDYFVDMDSSWSGWHRDSYIEIAPVGYPAKRFFLNTVKSMRQVYYWKTDESSLHEGADMTSVTIVREYRATPYYTSLFLRYNEDNSLVYMDDGREREIGTNSTWSKMVPSGQYTLYEQCYSDKGCYDEYLKVHIYVSDKLYRSFYMHSRLAIPLELNHTLVEGAFTLKQAYGVSHDKTVTIASMESSEVVYERRAFTSEFAAVDTLSLDPGLYSLTLTTTGYDTIPFTVQLLEGANTLWDSLIPGTLSFTQYFLIPGENITPIPVPLTTVPVTITRVFTVNYYYETVYIYRRADTALVFVDDGKTAAEGITRSQTIDLPVGEYDVFLRCYLTCGSQSKLLVSMHGEEVLALQFSPSYSQESSHTSFTVRSEEELAQRPVVVKQYSEGSDDESFAILNEEGEIVYSRRNPRKQLFFLEHLSLPSENHQVILYSNRTLWSLSSRLEFFKNGVLLDTYRLLAGLIHRQLLPLSDTQPEPALTLPVTVNHFFDYSHYDDSCIVMVTRKLDGHAVLYLDGTQTVTANQTYALQLEAGEYEYSMRMYVSDAFLDDSVISVKMDNTTFLNKKLINVASAIQFSFSVFDPYELPGENEVPVTIRRGYGASPNNEEVSIIRASDNSVLFNTVGYPSMSFETRERTLFLEEGVYYVDMSSPEGWEIDSYLDILVNGTLFQTLVCPFLTYNRISIEVRADMTSLPVPPSAVNATITREYYRTPTTENAVILRDSDKMFVYRILGKEHKSYTMYEDWRMLLPGRYTLYMTAEERWSVNSYITVWVDGEIVIDATCDKKMCVQSFVIEGRDVPTTVPPTTLPPTTEVPTTLPPTTIPPTQPPTTLPPTTLPPTTLPPTTEVPTTVLPTTQLPTTEVPTTIPPTTLPPTTEAPTTLPPTTQTPTTLPPTTLPPTTLPPTTPPPPTLYNECWGDEPISQYMTELVIGNGVCNDVTEFDLSKYPLLRSVRIGNNCFRNVDVLNITGLNELKSVEIGMNSFTESRNYYGSNANRHFSLKNCPKLMSLKIGQYSFSDYAVIEIENVNSLEVIEIGDAKERGYGFYYASLELKSILIHRE